MRLLISGLWRLACLALALALGGIAIFFGYFAVSWLIDGSMGEGLGAGVASIAFFWFAFTWLTGVFEDEE